MAHLNTKTNMDEEDLSPRSGTVVPTRQRIIAAVCLFCASSGVTIAGFVQAYTFDSHVMGTGAPPVSVMAGVLGLALFLEVMLLMTRTSEAAIASTSFYRLFVYGSVIPFGFLTMCFYANTGEGLAAFGAVLWIGYAIVGFSYVKAMVSEETAKTLVRREQLRRCCGVGCCTRSGCGMCCRWFLWTLLLLFFVQACCTLSDSLVYLQGGQATFGRPITLVPATSIVENKRANLAIFCHGTKAPNDPTVLLEAGGGSGIGSTLPLLRNLTATFGLRVCSYSRPGYLFSQTSLAYPHIDNGPHVLYQALAALNEQGPFVCAGHSAGGTQCRSLQRLYPSAVSGIVLLDAYCNSGPCNIEFKWALATGGSESSISATFGIRRALVDLLRFLAPFAVLRMFIGGGGILGANIGGNIAWHGQFADFRGNPNTTQEEVMMPAMWYTPNVLNGIPLVIATAGAVDQTCAEKGAIDNEFGKGCTNLLQRQNATIAEVQLYLQTSNFSRAFDCRACNHGFVTETPQIAARYVMIAVHAARFGVWPPDGLY